MNNLFNNISPKNKEKLLKMLEANTLHFKENTVIFKTIKKEDIIGIVLTGRIEITKVDYNGNKTIIEELNSNDLFGTQISSLNNNEYDIITKEDTIITIFEYQRIINHPETNKEYYNTFLKNLLQITVNKINEKNERIEILTRKSIRNKLLEYFRILSKKNGTKKLYLPFSFTDLADYLAVDRSAMSRELKNLKEEGFIEIKQKRITLLY